jgi:hypothetical protein
MTANPRSFGWSPIRIRSTRSSSARSSSQHIVPAQVSGALKGPTSTLAI